MIFVTLIACDGEQQTEAEKIATNAEKPTYQKKITNTKYTPVAGKYVHPTNPEQYLLLNANGSYLLTNSRRHANGGQPYTGTFSMTGNQIRMQLNAKQSTTLQFKDGAVVDSKGARWEKQ